MNRIVITSDSCKTINLYVISISKMNNILSDNSLPAYIISFSKGKRFSLFVLLIIYIIIIRVELLLMNQAMD